MFSFDNRKQTLEVQRRVRRLADLTTPNLDQQGSQERAEDRCNRTIPVLLCPWEDNRPALDACMYALTKDISTRGVGLVMNQPFRAVEVVVGFWLDDERMQQPWFFLGTTQRLQKIGGGYWAMGIEFDEFVGPPLRDQLAPLETRARQLQPAPAPAGV